MAFLDDVTATPPRTGNVRLEDCVAANRRQELIDGVRAWLESPPGLRPSLKTAAASVTHYFGAPCSPGRFRLCADRISQLED